MPAREAAETLRILGRYKRLVLLGRVQLPLGAARQLVGPDCAYHLYFRHTGHRQRGRARRPGDGRDEGR